MDFQTGRSSGMRLVVQYQETNLGLVSSFFAKALRCLVGIFGRSTPLDVSLLFNFVFLIHLFVIFSVFCVKD